MGYEAVRRDRAAGCTRPTSWTARWRRCGRPWPELRWTGRDAWHLTLAFLGEVDETGQHTARRRGWSAPRPGIPASRCPSAARAPSPAPARARVLWTGVQGEPRGLRHAGRVGRRRGAPGGRAARPEEGRRFQPHLTLARCREPADVRPLVATLAGYAGTPWTAGEIYLIRSHLPGGRPHDRPRYETLGAWPLRVPPCPSPASWPGA